MIFDTNVLIYLSKNLLNPQALFLEDAGISVITKIEALGYSFQNIEEYEIINSICSILKVIPVSDAIAEATINLRKNYRIKLPDALIYATAFVESKPLLTNNMADFASLDNKVILINPFSL
ncbi:type II toxin-antitoxin system VapC family toxin [Mucilaginibacter terrae]|uniref:type II toxin-antitoxin system VapC family toxin n=1 Tax=Mucilaginibacter terrae TaxID=1955052 RepID=UPI0036442DB1